MSTVTPPRPPAPRSAGPHPRRAAPASSARSIDPFRVLRRHIVLLVCTGVFGGALGGATYFTLNKFVPLYSGEVLFEIRAGLSEARDVGSHDIAQDDLVMRLASTETQPAIHRVARGQMASGQMSGSLSLRLCFQ